MLVRSLPRRATDRLCHHQVLLVCCASFAYPTRAREPFCNPPFEARTGAPGYQADTRRGQTAATSSHHAGDTVNTEETLVPTSGRTGCCHSLGSVLRGFFGFLRAGEFTVPSRAQFDPAVHMTPGDVAVDSHASPSLIRLRLKQSKTDPFRRGCDIYLGKTDAELCPVRAMLAYLARRGAETGPLFLYEDGFPLSRDRLVTEIRESLTACGRHPDGFSGHSFRIGAATTAASRGLEDSTIQTLGRWRSEAFKRYVRLDAQTLASFSRSLVAPP